MRQLLSCFILIVWGSCFLCAEIIECQRLRELLPLVDQDTLVVFNINNVLTVSRQDAGSTPWAEEHIAQLMREKKVDKPHATNLFIPLWHDVLIASDVELFDPDAEAIVHFLQQANIKVMALTNRYVEMGYPTHSQLRSVGIDFVKNPPHLEDTFVSGIESPAKYIEGILFNGLINFKGDTLAAFLKQINYYPKKLIYIEDKPKHLAQVGEKIAALGIPFLGIHFGALELQRQAYQSQWAALQVKFHQDILDDASALRLYHFRKKMPVTALKPLVQVPVLPENMDIQQIASFEELKKDLIPHTLMVTELDHVLWETPGSIGARVFLNHREEQYKQLGHPPSVAKQQAERLFEKIQRRAQVKLIEPDNLTFFKELIAKNCWSVAVTYRPDRLLQRTDEQAKSVGLQLHSPFQSEHAFLPEAIICASAQHTQFENFEEKLSKASIKPTQILAVSAQIEDLLKLQAVAERQKIPFQGRLFVSSKQKDILLDDEVLAIELEYVDRLITNADAEILLRN